jgi:hypothetical protein
MVNSISDTDQTSGVDRIFQMLEICEQHVCASPHIATTFPCALSGTPIFVFLQQIGELFRRQGAVK